ncbi:MAG: ABC-2 transporter permease [Defluviitaleaceae bacterium]|nr:ABC-2 transporter permease [Defluviitaleaceae bacterium]MCL2274255.1 ABC-2 transporter permease [Defluviitaleaceae bacterium]
MIKNIIKLDLYTARPGFNWVAMLIQFTIIGLVFGFTRNMIVPVFVIMMIMDGFVALPFSLGEPAKMDVLYTTLNIKRKTMVIGRYCYAGFIIVCTTLLSLLLVGISWGVEWVFEIYLGAQGALYVLLLYFVICIFMQSVLLPFYYKFTIIKAGPISYIPFYLIMLGSFFLINFNYDLFVRLVNFVTTPSNLPWVIAIVLAVLAVIVYISFRLSVRFYTRREFS